MHIRKTYLMKLVTESVSIAPLVVFRILAGSLMALGGIRFLLSGWIQKLYIEPDFFFKFYGFEWVIVPESPWMLYGLHIIIVLSAIGIALGWKYRFSAVIFFLSFSYAEFMDATNYLNHYYLVILVAFLMIFLPANRKFSIDALLNPSIKTDSIPRLYIDLLKWQIGIVYFFAGLAKVNWDWLFHAMPLAVWLPARVDTPLLGVLFEQPWAPFLFSWFGAAYDLFIILLLTNRKLWKLGYLLVIIFHLMTRVLFNIGMFPYIMICFTTIFIPVPYHEKLLAWGSKRLSKYNHFFQSGKKKSITNKSWNSLTPSLSARWMLPFLILYFSIQIIAPLRHLFYPGSVHWNEEGYRWSWRVMVLEKSGTAIFTVEDPKSGRKFEVENNQFLTEYQEKQMAFQPDFILQFAHFLKDYYAEVLDSETLQVSVMSKVSVNGRKSHLLIDPGADLTGYQNSWAKKRWILSPEPENNLL